jgi:hypothetical protein
MNIATYDNPATMQRECWQDGKLLCAYSYRVIGDVPAEYYFFGANIGDWKTGQLVGDKLALSKVKA